MKPYKEPKLTLVGAGPGDPELITLKGLKALQSADVILYDALVSPVLLDHAPRARKIFVGKRKGGIYTSQEDINTMIIEYAFSEGHVVRLKGGDPFIFGRGSEELEYADSFGIPGEVIPGISSTHAVPASAGIPLTHRKLARGYWVVTGTTADGELADDIALAAQSSATVVILMGMARIREISELFLKAGKGETPVAVIQNGTTPREKVGLARVNSMVDMVEGKGLTSPAIIVIGEVAAVGPLWRKTFNENGALVARNSA